MASLLQNAKQQWVDSNGRPLVGGKVYFYQPGTEVPKTTWQDQAATIPNANPVVLDARGQAVVWGSGSYRQVVYDRNGILIWDQVTTDVSDSVTQITTNLAGSNGSNLVGFLQAWVGPVTRPVQSRLRDQLPDIRDWDVTAGIGHDDTSAMEAAFASGAPGLKISPNQVISLSRKIVIPAAGFKVLGSGPTSKVVQIGTGENAYCFYATGLAGVEVSGLVLTPGTGATTTRHGFAIFLDTCTLFSITGNRITAHLTGGIGVQGCSDGFIGHNQIYDANTPTAVGTVFSNVSGYDIGILNGGQRINVVGNRSRNGCSIGVGIQSYTTGGTYVFQDIAVVGNVIEGQGRYGIMCYKLNLADTMQSIAISGNSIADISGALVDPTNGAIFGAGIYVQGAEGVAVTGNVVRRCNINTGVETLAPGAIGTTNCRDVSITGNTIRSTYWYGIAQNNSNNTGEADGSSQITGNNIYSCAKAGIYLNEFAASMVANNAVAKSDIGIRVKLGPSSLAEDFTITGNRLTENVNQGILIESGNANIVGNQILRNGNSGIRLQGAGRFVVSSNRVASNALYGLDVDVSITDISARDNIFAANTTGPVRAGVPIRGLRDNQYDTPSPNIASAGGYFLEFQLDATATPNVKNMDMGFLPTGGAAVTDFLNGYIGQEITVRASGAVTITQNAAIALKGAVNANMANGNVITFKKRAATAWIETSRNF